MQNTVYYLDFETALGVTTIFVYNQRAVYVILNQNNRHEAYNYIKKHIGAAELRNGSDQAILNQYAGNLKDYLSGKTKKTDIPFTLYSTGFTLRVLTAVSQIGYGKMLTYSDVATMLGCRAYRAVGQAVRRNPLPLIIPCHRVTGKGNIGGFGLGGLDLKRKLLELEGIDLSLFKK